MATTLELRAAMPEGLADLAEAHARALEGLAAHLRDLGLPLAAVEQARVCARACVGLAAALREPAGDGRGGTG